MSRDEWAGNDYRPGSLNKWNYAYSNPVRFTDPKGENPIEACVALFAALAIVDGPLPVGEVTGAISCLAILGGSYLTVMVAQHAPDLATGVDTTCKTNWIEWLYTRPVAPNPQRTPTSQPKIQPVPFPNPGKPKATETPEPKHIFYYAELGEYNPGRETSQIKQDLRYISHIPGIPGLINQLESASFYPLIMGRKFESERAIYYYKQHQLQEVNSTSERYDLLVTNMGTIKYIEVKWSQGAIDKATLTKVISEARLHPSRTFMLETTWITLSDQAYLFREGGREYP